MTTTLDWLLEPKHPGVRFLALRDLVALAEGDPELEAARREAYASGPIGRILEQQDPEGFWESRGPGYGPKYRSTPWSILLLAQLGARVQDDQRIANGCQYLLDHTYAPPGCFGMGGTPSSTIDCLQGNLCWALSELGHADPRVDAAYEWMARSVTGDGFAPISSTAPMRYQARKVGPFFRCDINSGLSCGWGGVKVMQAFAALAPERRTAVVQKAIAAGADYMLENDPAGIGYPAGNGITSRWWMQFGFPLTYIADLLQNVDALVRLGYGNDPRLQPALACIRSKADATGRWMLERECNSQLYMSFGSKGKPSKWITWRALRVLQAV